MKFKALTDTFTLSNGTKIPCVGFGTWQSANGQECYNAVLSALECGYRHIDTAEGYGNEESVGKAIKDFLATGKCSRKDLYITSKLHNNFHSYEEAKAAIEKSLSDLQLDYIDLFLVHWPNPIKTRATWQKSNAEAWKAMEEAVDNGKIISLGLSNFQQHHIEELLKTARIKPVVNQIKFCPGINQPEVVKYSRSQKMVIEAYSPMGTGAIFGNEQMTKIARNHNKTVAQVCIEYVLQNDILPLPKSVTPERIKSNTEVFDFELTSEECKIISELKDTGIVPPRNPDEITF